MLNLAAVDHAKDLATKEYADTKAPASHNHAAGDVTSGTFDIARIPTITAAKGGTGKTSLINSANALINALSTGSSTPVDADYYISQYVGGGTTTTTYHRRPMSALWAYIKGKADAIYAALSHSHAISDVTNLQTTLNGKASSSHTHTSVDVTDLGTTSVGSASGWSAGTLPTKGTNIAADDITAWTTNTPTAVTPNTVVTGGTKTSIPNISKKTVVTGVTKKTVVTGGSTTSITPVTKKTVVTGVTKKTVVTGGSTTNITPVTKKTVITSASGATATIANGLLTIINGSFSTGDSVTEGTAVAAYTSLTTGDSVTVTTGDSVTAGTAVDVYTSLTTGDSVTVTTGDSVTVGTAIDAYTSLDTGPACSVTAGTAASLSYTARSIPNITAVGTLPSLTITNNTVATIEE